MRRVISGLGLGALLYSAAAGRRPHPKRPSPRERELLAAAIVSVTVEELLWRGPALQLLRSRLGVVPALAVSSAAFAAAHLPAHPRALVTHAGLAAAFGAAALRRGGLASAAVAHATYDTLVLLEEPAA